ncbi:MAG: aminodeoxychorismate synthase component I [Bradyrhizobiaceae bacterium]|nr:MAG: aminodeoxychorismate synthase component I [Bradyrhizobiaceae bacterium]
MKTLVIDNYDSFTYNLVHLIAEINQEEPVVVRNDETTWAELAARHFDNIVISPGPGRADTSGDFGVCSDVIARSQTPLLGVCLGHQGLAQAEGGVLAQAPSLVHGLASRIHHHGQGLFKGLPSPFEGARYHSFLIRRPLPRVLLETAWTEDGLVMGVAHRERPQWGVQFHPESVLTEHGRLLIQNFRDLSLQVSSRKSFSFSPPAKNRRAAAPASDARKAFWRELPRAVDTEAAYAALCTDAPYSFWLDSNVADRASARWSYIGDASGPRTQVLRYNARDRILDVTTAGGTRSEKTEILSYLDKQERSAPQTPPPYPFRGGYVGWFGYELRSDCGYPASRVSPAPDALLIRADRFIAVDHVDGKTYVCVIAPPDEAASAEQWIASTIARIETAAVPPMPKTSAPREPLSIAMDQDEAQYLDHVRQCLDLIARGETYQVCLTNELSCSADIDPFVLYRTVRRLNPAPFAALIRWPDGAVLSASPERFLSADAMGHVETKPIKGTIRRDANPVRDRALADELRASEKDRAENGMIVDLLRNDLSHSCEVGSVQVPKLFDIESFETVHQMVSTVRGNLKPDRSVADLLRDAFPGGSMTGAPKYCTVEFIDALEQRPRGIYSGCLGWIGDDGAADLSIVIRTIVAMNGRLTMGTGGGVVAASTPDREYQEMLLKAKASIAAIVTALYGRFDDKLYRLVSSGASLRGGTRKAGGSRS